MSPPDKLAKPDETALDIPRGLEQSLRHAADLAEDALSPATRRAYADDWKAFSTWAQARGISTVIPIPVPICGAYLADLETAGLRVTTIRRRLSGLAAAHLSVRGEDGEPFEPPTTDPAIRRILKGLARRRASQGERPNKKRPLDPSMASAALEEIGVRDRAIVLVALVTGLRRSELAAARWRDLEPADDGWILWVGQSKTDQLGVGQAVAIPRGRGLGCPVRALRDLRLQLDRFDRAGPDHSVFGCGPWTIAQVIKRVAAIAGEDPKQFGAHSTRAGMLTAASRAGVPLADIMAQSRHASPKVALGYIRPGEQARNPAARAIVDALGENPEPKTDGA
jgi:integrase